jgi:hypothetical protein
MPRSSIHRETQFGERPGPVVWVRLEPQKDSDRSALATIRSYFAVSILPDMALSRFDRFTGEWKRPNQPLVVALALKVGGCGWLRPVDAVVDRQPHERKATADSIKPSPP